MRDEHTPLVEVIESFLVHRDDLSPATATNYRLAIRSFTEWATTALERPAEIGDLEAGTVEAFLAHRKSTGSAQCARCAWVALRSVARFLAERRIHHEHGESTIRAVRMPKVKYEVRRALNDPEMWLSSSAHPKASKAAAIRPSSGRSSAAAFAARSSSACACRISPPRSGGSTSAPSRASRSIPVT
jgi:site-specific recombinase XerD